MSHAWETWLEARFPAYLLRCAEGRPHPAAAVAQALTRLAGDPGSLHQLAALAFLLDPESHVEAELFIPYSHHAVVAALHEHALVLRETHEDDGTRMTVRAAAEVLDRLQAQLDAGVPAQ